jgi:glycosyltransferase involved in cell wall biosynthesis
MKVAIDAVGIRGHGGAAVLCELLYWLPKVKPEWQWHVFLFERDLREFDDPPVSDCVVLEHTRFGNRGWERLKWVRRQLQDKIKSVGVDLLFSFANIASNNPRVPQIVFVQQPNAFFNEGIPKHDFFNYLRMNLMRRQILCGAKASRAVIVQTEAMHRRMLKYAPELNGRIHIIPSGFRTPSINPAIRSEVKAQIDFMTRPRLIYISMPRHHKNHIILIRAFSSILKIFPEASLILTEGKVDPHDHNMTLVKRDLKYEIQKLGIFDRVFWFEWLTPGEVNYAHASSDLMIFPSLTESFGLPLAEAMSVGCPIIAADLPYAHDVAGNAAIYFNPHNPEGLAECVISLLKSPETLRNLKKLSEERSVLFNYENISDQIANLIEKVAKGEIHN